MDAEDWKRKHFESLREMELEERRWRSTEQMLRRLVSRLCAVAHGPDPVLNAELAELADACRRDAEPAQLWTLCEHLSETAKALEDAAAPPPSPAASRESASLAEPAYAQQFRDLVARLIERLDGQFAETEATALESLRTDLAAAAGPADLPPLLESAAELVAARADVLGRERNEAAAILQQVQERLAEMASYLVGAGTAQREDHEATESLNTEVLAQMVQLSDAVRTGGDLNSLRAVVAGRLDVVTSTLQSFRERAESRFLEQDSRNRRMRDRIRELEDGMRDLSRDLDLEKRRARTDPLTRIANRASFDERLLQELARRRRVGIPAALIVWDIDRFKSINDAFGHRAVDALLRAVAAWLGTGRRAVDFLARYGGEEFVTLLVGSNLAEASRIAETMRGDIAALKLHFRGTPVTVTISCGLTELRGEDTPAGAFERADAALYRAKQGGRNRCVAD